MYGTQTYSVNFADYLPFENDVKMYGTQTHSLCFFGILWFENDVKMYGTQTDKFCQCFKGKFENDVKMYGVQHPNTQKHTFCHLQHPVRVFMCTLSLAFFHSL